MTEKRKEDPEKVYARQQEYRKKIEKIEFTTLTTETKEKSWLNL